MRLSLQACSAVFVFIYGWLVCTHLSAEETKETTIPRPEHPRPQMQRPEWLNLNGVWEFAETDEAQDARFLGPEPYPDRITVPFCRESQRSGLGRRGFVKHVWYRRRFSLPGEWRSPRARLHIGACDWRTRVWVNGRPVGEHTGGSAPFAFEITGALQPGENIVVIHAFDDTRSGLQALGKQSNREDSFGIFYTRTTGIWQTVWLEGVGASFLRNYRLTPDPQQSRVLLDIDLDGSWEGLTITATAFAEGKRVGKAERTAGGRHNPLLLPLAKKRLWSTQDPFLYDLELTLSRGNTVLDRVKSYFGLRAVSVEGPAILINGRRVFQRLVLDQGFYPDGIWTAPSDAALKGDIERSQALGFNGARLHQKVFEPRFLYWADRLGYLVWGEFPSFGADYGNPVVNLPIINEWVEIVRRDYNHPSIIGWCPFNETPREAGALQNVVVGLTRDLDPTRVILDTSGWSHSLPDPQLLDAHDYEQDPASFRGMWGHWELAARYGGLPEVVRERNLPFFISEYGGIQWSRDGTGWGYGRAPRDKAEFYERYEGLTRALLDNPLMFGFCYTQLTDVEQEQNGLYTYDRQPKFDAERLRRINALPAAYEKKPFAGATVQPGWKVLVGANPDGEEARPWRYTTEPPPEGWMEPDFDDSAWAEGLGAFGQKGGREHLIRTPWSRNTIALRQELTFEPPAEGKAVLVIQYDNDAEVYVNGELIWQRPGWNGRYAVYDVTEPLREAARVGKNVIAIHCAQDVGGQFIDAALLVEEPSKKTTEGGW